MLKSCRDAWSRLERVFSPARVTLLRTKPFSHLVFCVPFLAFMVACVPTQTTTVNPPTEAAAAATATTESAPEATATAESPPEATVTAQVTPTAEGPFQLQAPNPLRVMPQLDQERAVSAVITTQGGSLTAEAADGSLFILTVPPDALLSDQLITLTPLLGVDGQRLSGGFAAGVHLAPEGLQLFDAATLVILPARAVPVESELSFAVHGKDQEVLLYPLLPGPPEATFIITHFSAYFIALGNASDALNQMLRPPSSASDQFLQQMQALIAAERNAALKAEAGSADFHDRAANLARSYLRQVLIPRIQEAENSDDYRLVCQVIAEVMGFERTLHFLGITDELDEFDADAALEKLLLRQAELLQDAARALCRSDRRLEGWRLMLRVARTQAIKGINYGVSLSDWMQSCGSLQLSFMSRSIHTLYDLNTSRLVRDVLIESEVPLRYDADKSAFTGEGPITLEVIDANSMQGYSSDSGNRYCDLSWNPTASRHKVEKLTLNLNQTECDSEKDDVDPTQYPGIDLTMDIGTPQENWALDCSKLHISPEGGLRHHKPWVNYFRAWHKKYLAEGSILYSEETGTTFKDPTLMLFKQWHYGPDRSYAYAVIDKFSSTRLCDICFHIEWDDETDLIVR
jgi:hypothetical protein